MDVVYKKKPLKTKLQQLCHFSESGKLSNDCCIMLKHENVMVNSCIPVKRLKKVRTRSWSIQDCTQKNFQKYMAQLSQNFNISKCSHFRQKRKWVVKIIFNTLCVYFYVQEQLFTYVQVQIFDNFSAGFSTDNF